MSASNSGQSPPRSKLPVLRLRRDANDVSDDVHADRLLAYKPIVSSEAKPGPLHLNTKGQAPSGRNVGKLAGLLKMPPDIFREVIYEIYTLLTTKFWADCFEPSSVGYSSPCAHVPEYPRHPYVKRLGPHLGHREEDPRHARVSPRSQ